MNPLLTVEQLYVIFASLFVFGFVLSLFLACTDYVTGPIVVAVVMVISAIGMVICLRNQQAQLPVDMIGKWLTGGLVAAYFAFVVYKISKLMGAE